MTSADSSDNDQKVGLDTLVAAAIGRYLPRLGFVESQWLGGEVRARHASGDEIRIRVEVVE